MNELAQQHCSPIRANTPQLNDQDVSRIKNKTGWQTYEKSGELRLEKVFKFKDFRDYSPRLKPGASKD